MIHSIYHEIREKRFRDIVEQVDSSIVEKVTLYEIFRGYYFYLIGNEDEYYFIKQFSSCPCLIEEIKLKKYEISESSVIDKFIKDKKIIDFDKGILHSLLASPIERMAENYYIHGTLLNEKEVKFTFDLIWKGICNNS
jgi:hypothetical protein